MDILYAGAEMVPYVKVGGLADVAAALTKELALRGHRVRALLPVYPAVRRHWSDLAPREVGRLGGATLHLSRMATGLELVLIEEDRLFDRPDPYVDPETGRDWPDNAQRFACLSRAVPALCAALDWTPDVVHLNDYQFGPSALLMRSGRPAERMPRTAILYSIHNLGYQGLFPLDYADETPEEIRPASLELLGELEFPAEAFDSGGALEFHGRLNFMKAGVVCADLVSTVSPTYAAEIQTTEHGFGLDDVLRARRSTVIGILNGIDVELWNPATDQLLPYCYGPSDFQRKRENKARLLEVTHLPGDLDVPLIGMITRLVDQKGLDLIEQITAGFLEGNSVRMVVLGSGMPSYEALMKRIEERHPQKFATHIGFNEPLAHLIEAGCDFFLMPSRYEPCGLNQMYSMRYGTVPIVRATGGLADTVEEVNLATGTGSGFVFRDYTPEALLATMERALAAYGRTRAFKALVTRIMGRDFSWGRAARAYEKAYQRAINEMAKP